VAYTVTLADLNQKCATPSWSITNSAEVKGTPPKGADVTDDSTAIVQLSHSADLLLVKTGDFTNGDGSAVGDEVTWYFTVTNVGTTTITDITIDDAFPGLSPIVFGTWPGLDFVLEPGQVVTASATSLITQADLDAGVNVVNHATARGKDPRDADVSSDDDADVPVIIIQGSPPPSPPPTPGSPTGKLPFTGPAGMPGLPIGAFALVMSGLALLVGFRRRHNGRHIHS
jgi:uncharacterized repeat protein (TIGR01451 family)/LPXTG-motif cell wall-anchored protein